MKNIEFNYVQASIISILINLTGLFIFIHLISLVFCIKKDNHWNSDKIKDINFNHF